MDTAWLEVFRQIARCGSFTAAARAAGYTQSAISRQISALESEVGAQLFDRQARGVQLTEAGRFLLAHAEAVLDRLDAAKRDLTALSRLEAGRLRVGSFATAGVALLPQAIAEFRAAHPGVAISHADGLSARLVEAVAADDLDVAVVTGYPDQIDDFENVRLHALLDEPMLVALPGGHRLAGRESVRLSELENESWIAGSAAVEETLIRAALRREFRPDVAYVVRDWIAKQGFVAAGLGVTLVPALAVDSVRADVALARLDEPDVPTRGIRAALPDDRAGAPAAAAFVSQLEDSARRLRDRQFAEAREADLSL
ncbi:MAG: LysR family transcriptional regulator [Stackebrandtia sp.]